MFNHFPRTTVNPSKTHGLTFLLHLHTHTSLAPHQGSSCSLAVFVLPPALRLQATAVFRFDPRSKVWSSSPRRGRYSSLAQWPFHSSAFLNCWTSGTSSLHDGQIAEWVPILTFCCGSSHGFARLDNRDPFLQDVIGSGSYNHATCLPWSSRPLLCVASFPGLPRNRLYPRTEGT